MKILINNISIAVWILFSSSLLAQTADLTFSESLKNSTNYIVKIEIKGFPAFKLGTSNITFNFNNDVLNAPVLDSVFNYSRGLYNIVTITNPLPGVCSINFELFLNDNGQTVDTSWTDVVSVKFNVTNSLGHSGLVFRTSPPNRTNIWADDNSILIQQGYYESLNSPLLVENEKPPIDSYKLFNNYPNPFNPSTTIKYSIKTTGIVKLEVYDILGKMIKTLVDEEKSAGEYKVNFNGNNLVSGIYIYRLTVGSFNQVRKMLLLK